MVKPSKRYKAATESADLNAEFSVQDAISTLNNMPKAKFDETVEMAFRLGVDPRQGDQMIRGTVTLPHGSGKKVTVLAFTSDVDAAKEAGADHAGLDDMIAKIKDEGWLDFDVAVATPDAMKSVRQIARVLGPKGLMPNPKSGTVSPDLTEAIKAVKAGRVEFKMDKTANIGVGFGKRSFSSEQLVENANALINAVAKARPASFKGKYINNISIASTMSPGIRIASGEYSKL